jgi:serine/threonine protein kinase
MTSPQTEDFPTLGRYQVINRIASGGMAEVFLAKAVGAMGFQRLVAVKLIHANFTRDPEFVNMFIDEARIAMHLHHRNIVQVFDLDSEGDTYFIAMEFVHGVNLYDLYERIAAQGRWIEVPMALYLVAEVSKGLHFAHTRTGAGGKPLNIVHRDISPQNVLLSFEGEVKITDFGIATAAERLHQTAAGIVKGKYAYMAPERLQEKPIDARVDVFSVGVLLYELLVGENPFAGTSAVDTIENVLNRKVPAPSERGAPVSRRLDEICLKALAKDPAQRYASAQALADAVTEYALELTHARKDMAAGDAAVANLLGELFPERARTHPGAAEPGRISLPGIDGKKRPSRPAVEERPTEEQLPASSRPTLEETEDFDAPTIMKMAPVDPALVAPRLVSLDEGEPQTAKSQDSLPSIGGQRGDSGLSTLETPRANDAQDPTTPTEIPSGMHSPHDTLEQPLVMQANLRLGHDEDEEAFATTMPSQNSLDVLDSEPEVQTPPGAGRSPLPYQMPVMPQMAPVRGAPQLSPMPMYPPPYGESQDQLVVPVGQAPEPQPSGFAPAEAPKSSKMNYVAGALLVVAVLVVVAALVVVRQGATALVDVPLTVVSIPEGAKVLLNGVEQPQVTPANLRVPVGQTLTVELELPGYQPLKKQLMPLEGSTLQIEERLLATSGSLIVRPTPAEARVFVDGKDRGQGTVSVQGLPLGEEILVRVELDGHEPFEERVSLAPERASRTVTANLEATQARRPAPRAAARRKVMLRTPYGTWANVYFNGQRIGTTPVQATLPVGKVELQVRNDEAKVNKTITVDVPRDGEDTIELKF